MTTWGAGYEDERNRSPFLVPLFQELAEQAGVPIAEISWDFQRCVELAAEQ